MSTGSISDESLQYFERKRIRALLDEAMRDVLMAMPEDPLLFLEQALQKGTPLRLIVAGLPGSGKGTQCARLAAAYGLEHISTGDLLRGSADNATAEGDGASEAAQRIAFHVVEGSLVPDELFVNVVVQAVRQAEAQGRGWVLDGFPRTRAQAIYLQSAGISPQRFFLLDVPESVGAARLLARRRTEAKTDDTPTAVKTRLEYFGARKEELIDCYMPFYIRIDANHDADEVFAELTVQCDAVDIAK